MFGTQQVTIVGFSSGLRESFRGGIPTRARTRRADRVDKRYWKCTFCIDGLIKCLSGFRQLPGRWGAERLQMLLIQLKQPAELWPHIRNDYDLSTMRPNVQVPTFTAWQNDGKTFKWID